MSVRKRKNRSGEIVWAYRFDAPDSTKARRHEIRRSGFTTKNEAINAEAARRLEVVQKEYNEAKTRTAGSL